MKFLPSSKIKAWLSTPTVLSTRNGREKSIFKLRGESGKVNKILFYLPQTIVATLTTVTDTGLNTI